MRRLGLIGSLLFVFGALVMASSVPVLGDGPITVSVTAEAQACLTVETTSINYGTAPFGGSSTREVSNIDNCSTVTQELFAQGADITSGPAWQIVDSGNCTTLPANQFRHEIGRVDFGTVLLSDATAKSIGTMLPATDNVNLATTFHMPCLTSVGSGETAQTTISLTAVLPAP